MDLYMTDQGDLKEYTITQEDIDQYRTGIEERLSKELSLKKPLKADSKKYTEELAKKLANKTSGDEKNNESSSNLTPEERLTILTELYNQENQRAQEAYKNSDNSATYHVEDYVNPLGYNVKKAKEEIALKLKKEAQITQEAYLQFLAAPVYIEKYPNPKEFIQQLESDIETSKTKIAALEKDQSSTAGTDSKESTLSPIDLERYNKYKLIIKAKTYYDDSIDISMDGRANLKEKSQECTVELGNIEKAIEPIKELWLKHDVEENKKIFITNKESDEAAIVYYNSLDKLEDFYKTEKERHKENPEKLKEYDIKLYDLQAEILQNRADELQSQGRGDSSKEAEGRSILAREYANKLNRSQIKEEKTKEANAKAHSFLGDIRNQQADFIDDLSTNKNLGPNQKKGKFLAQFLKQSVEIYVNNYYSGGNLHLKDQLQSLLINNGDTDIDMAIKGIQDNLPKYINQMNDTIGKELGKYSPALPTKGEISPERTQLIQKVKENSLYVITAKKINEVVEQTTKLTAEEKQHFASSAIIKTLYSVINYVSGNKKSQQYSELKLDEKSPAITKSSSSISSLLYSPIKNWKMSSKVQGIANSLKQIGISDVAGIKDIHRPETTRRSSGDFTDARSSIRNSINSVDFHDTRSSERNSRGG